MSQRRNLAPPPRATSMFARTIFEQFRRAGLSREDTLRFISEMVELVTDDSRVSTATPTGKALDGIVDSQTGLPNAAVSMTILEFECRKANASKSDGSLVVACLDIELPAWCPADAFHGFHSRLAVALREKLRSNDSCGRVSSTRYLLIMPQSASVVVSSLRHRLNHALFLRQHESDAALVASARIELRCLAWSSEMATADEFVARCSAATPVSLIPTIVPPSLPSVSSTERAVVLALGGGAARAMAHIGVFRLLQRAGISVAAVAGSSAGALVGAMFLSGMEANAILDRFASFPSTPLYRQMRRAYARHHAQARVARAEKKYFRESSLAFLSEDHLAAVSDELYSAFIEHFVGPDRDVATLARPFAACAADLAAGRAVNMNHGLLHAALRASCAIPGLFPPERDGDRLLVDGAVLAEVPIEVALQFKLEAPVLAVYLERPTRKVPEFANSLELATRANSLAHTELVREQLRHAPLLLTAPVDEIGWLDFRRAVETARIGELSAERMLSTLLAHFKRNESPDHSRG